MELSPYITERNAWQDALSKTFTDLNWHGCYIGVTWHGVGYSVVLGTSLAYVALHCHAVLCPALRCHALLYHAFFWLGISYADLA